MSENGFADAVELDEAIALGGEGDSPAPTEAFHRSPLGVLKSLADRPMAQALRCIRYVDSGRKREARFLKALTPQALALVASEGPNYQGAVKALQASAGG